MKRISAIFAVCLLVTGILAGCRGPEPATTGATQNNPSTTTMQPKPVVTLPSTEGSSSSQGRMNPHG